MKVIVSPAARDYIKSEIAYLKLRSPSAAVQLSEDLKRLKRDLGRFSQMGHFTEELPVPGIRRFVMGPISSITKFAPTPSLFLPSATDASARQSYHRMKISISNSHKKALRL